MTEKIYLDRLTQDSVSLRKQQFTTVEGVEFTVGEPWRKAYVNSTAGRATVASEVGEPYKTAIIAIWGSTPTVAESVSQ